MMIIQCHVTHVMLYEVHYSYVLKKGVAKLLAGTVYVYNLN